ncbi:hypothetical protein Glove_63g91 [Diversispora epigaea]|uniref:Uncharacterized protein n=1 Tax=Diversispora epigaea TaxID=1348612 RepID=A0A397JBF7_9GLOM|nr:hypothetical protein Glove_63g91 [Diversispora epigaea]
MDGMSAMGKWEFFTTTMKKWNVVNLMDGMSVVLELPSTPPNKVKSSSSDSEIVPKSLANIFLEVKNVDDDDDDILESRDLAQELLADLCLCPLKGHKWLCDGFDICNSFRDNKNVKTLLDFFTDVIRCIASNSAQEFSSQSPKPKF